MKKFMSLLIALFLLPTFAEEMETPAGEIVAEEVPAEEAAPSAELPSEEAVPSEEAPAEEATPAEEAPAEVDASEEVSEEAGPAEEVSE
jgi:hypothetical protein